MCFFRRLAASSSTDGDICVALRSRTFVWTLLCAGLFWSYTNFVYIGITFSYGTLAGNRLVNFVLINLTALPDKLILIPTVKFIKRRSSIFISLFLTGRCLQKRINR